MAIALSKDASASARLVVYEKQHFRQNTDKPFFREKIK
jgi:hypothetical protein